MIGSITSKEVRSSGNILTFNVNEKDYRPEVARITTRMQALDGTILITDWGYPESNRRITLSNIYMSQENYEALVGMKEDNSHVFHFHYKTTTWQVVIQIVEGFPEGDKRNVHMYLQVVSKISDGEAS